MVKSLPADDRHMRRCGLWPAKEPAEAGEQVSAAAHAVPAAGKVNKLTDIETSLILYGYGLPMALSVKGKCTTRDGRSAACETRKVSSEAVDFVYDNPPSNAPADLRTRIPKGSRVAVDLDEIGAFGGVVKSQTSDGFQLVVNKECRSALSTKLAQIAVKHGIGVEAGARMRTDAVRIEPKNKNCDFTDYVGTLRRGRIVNLSRFDALIRTAASITPPRGTGIVLRGSGWLGADVIISYEIGFVAKFCIPIREDHFSAALAFIDS